MDRLRWTEKAITFRNLVDDSSIQKPALVQIGTKLIMVGEKINGEFLTASPCKVSNNQFTDMEQEIVLSSKHAGIWRVISKSTSKGEGYIHRLTTKDIERIYKQDVRNERTTRRSYICTKDIEGFDLHILQHDPKIYNGNRIQRRKKYIEENVEFEITDIGEVEYTPTEGERTSQDYVAASKNKSGMLLQLFLPNAQETEQLVRNRALRTLYCTTKNEPHKRRFLLEVNEQSCDIRPIASEGSIELRYLHSTQNLFDYMLSYGNDTFLYVKLLRGDPPIKAVEFDGYMVLKNALNGDRIPICRVEDLEVTLVNPDLSIRVKLPKGDQTWRSLPEYRAAEIQCMQLSLALLARHESEIYVTIETEKNTSNYLQSNSEQEKRSQTSDASKKNLDESEQINDNQGSVSKSTNNVHSRPTKPVKTPSSDEKKTPKQQTKSSSGFHAASDKLYREDEKRGLQEHLKVERQRIEQKEKPIVPDKSIPLSLSNNSKTKTNLI